MLKQALFDIGLHRIQYKIDSFPSGKFSCWYEVRITGYEYNSINLVLECQRCNIYTYFHINTLLAYVNRHVFRSEIFHFNLSGKQFLYLYRMNHPTLSILQLA